MNTDASTDTLIKEAACNERGETEGSTAISENVNHLG